MGYIKGLTARIGAKLLALVKKHRGYLIVLGVGYALGAGLAGAILAWMR